MGEIVNLRRVKKAKARQEDAEAARANRIRFGRNEAEQANDRRARERQERAVGGARLSRAFSVKSAPALAPPGLPTKVYCRWGAGWGRGPVPTPPKVNML